MMGLSCWFGGWHAANGHTERADALNALGFFGGEKQ